MNSLCRSLRSVGPKGAVLNIIRRLQTEIISRNPRPFLPKLASAQNSWIWQKNNKIESPTRIEINKIDIPRISWIRPSLVDPTTEKVIEAPSLENTDIPKEAVRMIVIRRKKMKKHKLKKLRKRLRFVRAKLRQKRELQKEKNFQAILIKQCKDAEAFSAEDYVNSRLEKFKQLTVTNELNEQSVPLSFTRKVRTTPNK